MTHCKSILFALAVAAFLPVTAQQKRENYEFSFELPRYVEQLKKELTYPLAWENSGIADFSEWQRTARAKVRECMMTPPKASDDFNMEVVAEEQRQGYKALKILFNVNDYTRTMAYVLVPDGKGPFPAINLLHDHGGHLFIGKEKMIRPFGVSDEVLDDADKWAENLYDGQYMGDWLAQHGYVCFSADAPMWGERGREEGIDRGMYEYIAGNMMMLGRDLCAFMHYDDMAGTELLAQLPFVDNTRIGCVGCSMGAYRAWMLPALSDRIKAGAAVCWMVPPDVQMSTADGKREYGGFANCLPGLRQYMDYPHIAAMAAPKPMLFINGRQDKLFPVRGAEKAFSQMREVWNKVGRPQHLTTEMWDVPHSCGKGIQQRVLEFFDEQLKPLPQKAVDAVVAADGTGDYTSLQEAVDQAPDYPDHPYIIYVKEGTYKGHVGIPRSKHQLSIIGEGADKVWITDDRVSGGPKAQPVDIAATMVCEADGVYLEGISLVNSWGHEQQDGPQALALYTKYDRVIVNKCGLWSYQDTYRTANTDNGRNYIKDCTIEGAVDFIYGSGNAYFDHCTLLINRKEGGFIVAPKHAASTRWGYVFRNTTITAPGIPSETQVWLGRPWHYNPQTVFIDTRAEVTIPPEGWYETMAGWPTLFADFNTTDGKGNTVDLSKRISRYYTVDQNTNDTTWCVAKNHLTAEEAARYTAERVMGGEDHWNPAAQCRQLPAVKAARKGRQLQWKPVEGARGYLVFRNGAFYNSTTLTTMAVEKGGKYTVKALSPWGTIGQ